MHETDQMFESVAGYFRLLSETARLRVLHAICHEEKTVSQIMEATGLSQTNASRHLNMLFKAGALARRKEGTAVYYKVREPALIEICRAACVHIASQIEARAPLREAFIDFYSI